MAIRDNLNKILSSRYGKDVRQAIHDGIEEGYEAAVTAQDSASKAANTAVSKATEAIEAARQAITSAEEAKQSAESAFSTTPKGYEQMVSDVDLLKSAIIQTTDRTLYGSKAGGIKLIGVKGASEQKQYSGAQLLNYDAWKTVGIMNGTAVFENNGVTLTATARDAYTYYIKPEIEVSEGDIVTISWDLDVPYDGYVYIFANGNTIGDYTYAREKILSYQVPEGVAYVTFRVGVTNEGDTISYKNIMINKGDSALPWEPYVGGQSSPSSSYQQEIESVGDSVEVMQGCYGNANYVCSKYHIPCAGGDKVKLSTKDANNLTLIYFTDGVYTSYVIAPSVSENEFTVPNGVTSFLFNIHKDGGITPNTVGKIELTVNGKYILQIKQEGKNQFDKSKAQSNKQLSSGGGVSSVAIDGYSVSDYIKVKPNTAYYYDKLASANAVINRQYFDENKKFVITDVINGNTDENSEVHVTPDNCYYVMIGYKTSLVDYVQVVESDTATPYEPYHSNTITIPLNEPLREGDEIAVVDGMWEVLRGAKAFDLGTLGWYRSPSTQISDVYYFIANGVAGDCITYENSEVNTSQMCDAFIQKATINDIYYGTAPDNSMGRSTAAIWIRCDKYTSAEEFKTAMQGVQYMDRLATPVFEPFTDQSPFYGMQSYDTVTYISTDSKVEPSIEVKFGKTEVGATALEEYNVNRLQRIALEETKEMQTTTDEKIEEYKEGLDHAIIATQLELASTQTEVTNLSEKVDECFLSVSNGKALIASTITDKGKYVDATASFETMANNIAALETDSGTSVVYKVYSSGSQCILETAITTGNGDSVLEAKMVLIFGTNYTDDNITIVRGGDTANDWVVKANGNVREGATIYSSGEVVAQWDVTTEDYDGYIYPM